MAASAADVRSILSIQPSSTPGPSHPKKPALTARKPEGISRELYSLIGPSAPSLAAQLAKPRLKQKPSLGGGGKVKWEWRPFRNSARNDSLRLSHWVKAGTDPSADYPFAKYNVLPATYTYTQDEYVSFLEDADWSKEETDYLFSMVREYDLRWYIIYDRYDFPSGPLRTLEDLKDRYCSVCRKLLRNRPWEGDEQIKMQLISSFQFDKERELTRKKYISSLENRTPEQIAEEEALYIEIKRLEQNERKFKRERDDLLRTLAGIDSGLPDLPVDEDGLNMGGTFSAGGSGLIFDRKKKKGFYDLESPTNVIALGPPIAKRPPPTTNSAEDALHCIVRTDPLAVMTPATKAAHQAAHLRSFKIPAPKASIAPKVAQALAELGIQHTRLVMPTRENLAQLEALLDATYVLLETKKIMDKVEHDIRTYKMRLGLRNSEGQEMRENGGAGAEGNIMLETPADADAEGSPDRDAEGIPDNHAEESANRNAEGDVDEDGVLSVVSTRSGRSRKHARRSMSSSSADTSATVSVRTGTKRQKRT